ncbi:MAG: hypothetical protein RMJ53_07215 [Chitinophagales bacterium]|nr:hypothetical protein [Chitinophagales bacterium]
MNESCITVQRTARYYTFGQINAETKLIWLALHGYAQLACEFLEYFTPIAGLDTFIVAPEALNRFYVKGFTGKVGATWMTKEAREKDITDNIYYLNSLTEKLAFKELQLNKKIVTFGFSQGVATLTRWLLHANFCPDVLILYGGDIAAELYEKPVADFFLKAKCYICYGINDPFINDTIIERLHNYFKNIRVTWMKFDGGHEIKSDVIKEIKANHLKD